MTHVIFDLCIRDGACAEVCPVECIVPGQPEEEWPWYYIDPDTCIDCGACVPECPVAAILPEEDLPEEQRSKNKLEQFPPELVRGADLFYDSLQSYTAWLSPAGLTKTRLAFESL